MNTTLRGPGGAGRTPSIDALLELLDDEAAALDRLQLATRQCAALLATAEARFLGLACDELLAAQDDLAAVELLRATVVAGLARHWRMVPGSVTYAAVLARATSPQAHALEAYRTRFEDALVGIEHAQRTSRALAAAGAAASRAADAVAIADGVS